MILAAGDDDDPRPVGDGPATSRPGRRCVDADRVRATRRTAIADASQRRDARIEVAWNVACEKTVEIEQALQKPLAERLRARHADRRDNGKRFAATLRDLSVNGAFLEAEPLPLLSRVVMVIDVPVVPPGRGGRLGAVAAHGDLHHHAAVGRAGHARRRLRRGLRVDLARGAPRDRPPRGAALLSEARRARRFPLPSRGEGLSPRGRCRRDDRRARRRAGPRAPRASPSSCASARAARSTRCATRSPWPSATRTSGRPSASTRTTPRACPTRPSRRSPSAPDPRVVAVGETGLDYHYNHSPRAEQRALSPASSASPPR